jgi:hypothetical protein
MGRAGGNYVKPDPGAALHDSLRGPLWRLAQLFPKKRWERRLVDGKETWVQKRKISLQGRRRIPPGASVHDAAYARGEAYAAKLPEDAVRVKTIEHAAAETRYAEDAKKARA